MQPSRFLTNRLFRRGVFLGFAGLFLLLIFVRLGTSHNTVDQPRQPVPLSVVFKNEVTPRLLDVAAAEDFEGVDTGTMWEGVNCTFPDQYWKDHPDDWPVENVLIGKFSYDRSQLSEILSSDGQDLQTRLLRQFLTSVFNVVKGADSETVTARIEEAAAWIDANLLKNSLSEPETLSGETLVKGLEDFNLGVAGSSPCPGYELVVAPSPTATLTPTPRVISAQNLGVPVASVNNVSKDRSANQRRQSGSEIPASSPNPPTPQPVIDVFPPISPDPTQPASPPEPDTGQEDPDGEGDPGNEGGPGNEGDPGTDREEDKDENEDQDKDKEDDQGSDEDKDKDKDEDKGEDEDQDKDKEDDQGSDEDKDKDKEEDKGKDEDKDKDKGEDEDKGKDEDKDKDKGKDEDKDKDKEEDKGKDEDKDKDKDKGKVQDKGDGD